MSSRTTIKGILAGTAIIAVAVISAALPVGAQQPPSDESLYVIAEVDNDRPYHGQQIIYLTKIYQRLGFPHQYRYAAPDFAGFWNVDETEERENSVTIDSNEYRVIEQRTILFPSIVRTVEIEPARLTITDDQADSPIVAESSSITVEVQPLPSAAPDGFTGAVGKFDISAEVDTTAVRMNESVQLTVNVEGEGNIDALPEPVWPEFNGWRVVESPAAASREVIDGKLVGTRTFRRVLVPQEAGELTVPEIRYGYFAPELEEYVQAATTPIVVSVSETDETVTPPSSTVDTAADESDASVPKPIRPVLSPFRPSSGELTDKVVYWAAWTLPLLVILSAVVWRRRRDAWEASLLDARRRNALPNAQSTLRRAIADGGDPAVAAADAVHRFLSDRYGESLVGLTREAIGERLRDSRVADELAERVENTLALGEAARFTPETPAIGQTEDYIQRVSQLLTELDGAIKE